MKKKQIVAQLQIGNQTLLEEGMAEYSLLVAQRVIHEEEKQDYENSMEFQKVSLQMLDEIAAYNECKDTDLDLRASNEEGVGQVLRNSLRLSEGLSEGERHAQFSHDQSLTTGPEELRDESLKEENVGDYRQEYEPPNGPHDCVLQQLDELRASRKYQMVSCLKLLKLVRNVAVEVQPSWNTTNAWLLRINTQGDLQLVAEEDLLLPNTKNSKGRHKIKNASQEGTKIDHNSLCSLTIKTAAYRSEEMVPSWMVIVVQAAVWAVYCEADSRIMLPKAPISVVDYQLPAFVMNWSNGCSCFLNMVFDSSYRMVLPFLLYSPGGNYNRKDGREETSNGQGTNCKINFEDGSMMQRKIELNVVAWKIAGNAQEGEVKDELELFPQMMKQKQFSQVAFVCMNQGNSALWTSLMAGMPIDGITLAAMPYASSHSGLVNWSCAGKLNEAIELMGHFLQNQVTSSILYLARRNMPTHWRSFVQRLQLAVESSALRNSKVVTPEVLVKLISENHNACFRECKSSYLQEFRAEIPSGSLVPSAGICHGVSRSALWLPLDLVLEEAMDGSQVTTTSAIEIITGLMKSLQALYGTTWHEGFLSLWMASLRLVQRERDPTEGPVPRLETRMCMLLSITTLVVSDVIEEEERTSDEEMHSSSEILCPEQPPWTRRRELVYSLQSLGDYQSLLTPPQSVIAAANQAAAKAMMFVSGVSVGSSYFECISMNDMPINCCK